MIGYKVLTHDLRSPVRSGEPLCDYALALPFRLPRVALDTSDAECAAGWNFTKNGAAALRIAGFWPDGRSSRVFEVEASDDAIERGDKCRASSLTLTKEVSAGQISEFIGELSAKWFTDVSEQILQEQLTWRWLLGVGFNTAVGAKIRKRARGARDAWGARDARGARDAWDARGAWGARDARGAWGARDAWGARGAWGARDAWGAWDAWDAWDALTVFYVCRLRAWMPLPDSYSWLPAGGVASLIAEK